MRLSKDTTLPAGKAHDKWGGPSRLFNSFVRPLVSGVGLPLRRFIQSKSFGEVDALGKPLAISKKNTDVKIFADRQVIENAGKWSIKVDISPRTRSYFFPVRINEAGEDENDPTNPQKMVDGDYLDTPLVPSEAYVIAENLETDVIDRLVRRSQGVQGWVPFPQFVGLIPTDNIRKNELKRANLALELFALGSSMSPMQNDEFRFLKE